MSEAESPPWTAVPEGVRLALRVIPRAGVNAIGEVRAGRLQVKVTAVPADGAANAAVVKLLARACGLPPSRVELVSGASAREKVVLLRGAILADLPWPA